MSDQQEPTSDQEPTSVPATASGAVAAGASSTGFTALLAAAGA
jgi:hypothetical protein